MRATAATRLLPVFALGALGWSWGPRKSLPPDAKTQADAARLSDGWGKQGRRPNAPRPIVLGKGQVLTGFVVRGGVPKEGLTSATPAGTKFYVETPGYVAPDDRRLISNHSRLYGEVLEAWPYQADPYRPARLKLWFYKLEDKVEKKTFPIAAIATKTDGLDVSSGGTILGARRVFLGDGWSVNVTLLEDVPLYLEHNVRGIGVWGHWEDKEGFRVTEVTPWRAAADAGIQAGDVFRDIDGGKPDKNTAAMDLLDGEAGTTLSLKVVRGRLKPFKVTLERGVEVWEGLGIWCRKEKDGFRITAIAEGADPEIAKIPPGSIIFAMDGKPLSGLSDAEFARLLARRPGAKVEVAYRSPQAESPRTATLTAYRLRRTLPR